jgi:hypothetical protein
MQTIRLIAALVAAAATVGIGSSVDADAGGVGDPKDDVFVYDWAEDEGDWGWWDPDISRVRVNHTADRVNVTLRFHRFSRYSWDEFDIYVDARRPAEQDSGVDFHFYIDWLDPSQNGVYRGMFGVTKLCDIRVAVNYRQDYVFMSAPRSCFKNPRRVRVWSEFWVEWAEFPGVDCCYNWATDDTRWTPLVVRG